MSSPGRPASGTKTGPWAAAATAAATTTAPTGAAAPSGAATPTTTDAATAAAAADPTGAAAAATATTAATDTAAATSAAAAKTAAAKTATARKESAAAARAALGVTPGQFHSTQAALFPGGRPGFLAIAGLASRSAHLPGRANYLPQGDKRAPYQVIPKSSQKSFRPNIRLTHS